MKKIAIMILFIFTVSAIASAKGRIENLPGMPPSQPTPGISPLFEERDRLIERNPVPAFEETRPPLYPDSYVLINSGGYNFYIARREINQAQFSEMFIKPILSKAHHWLAAITDWFDAIEYCNKASHKEGLTPVYHISGEGDNRTVSWNRSAYGYRLATQAELEYALNTASGQLRTGEYVPDVTPNPLLPNTPTPVNYPELLWNRIEQSGGKQTNTDIEYTFRLVLGF